MQTEKDKYIFGVVKVGEKGQIVIPKEATCSRNPARGQCQVGSLTGAVAS